MASLGHFGEYDEFLAMLAEAQRYKLRVNAHKGFLGDVPPIKLMELLIGEISELQDAASRGSKIEMILEAADIANFALGFVIAALRDKNQLAAIKGQPVKDTTGPFETEVADWSAMFRNFGFLNIKCHYCGYMDPDTIIHVRGRMLGWKCMRCQKLDSDIVEKDPRLCLNPRGLMPNG